MLSELSPRQGFEQPETSPTFETLEKFRLAETKIAVQKDGELTDISRSIIAERYGIEVPPRDPAERLLVNVSEDGQYGFVYARNKSICDLVGSGAVSLAVVGTDRLLEDGAEDKVDIIESYDEEYSWPLVLATARENGVESPEQIKRIATQYPRIAQRFFEEQGLVDIEIVPTAGSTELYPYLEYDEKPIDGIIDMCITGGSLKAHNLVAWEPSIGNVYPVLIKTRGGQDV